MPKCLAAQEVSAWRGVLGARGGPVKMQTTKSETSRRAMSFGVGCGTSDFSNGPVAEIFNCEIRKAKGDTLIRLGSFCTGYGGLELGLAAVLPGVVPVWCCEVNPDASRVLAQRFPGVPNCGDLTTVDWSQMGGVDIVTAGWPCQPFSHIGKRKGAQDDRAIWPLIAKAVRALRPSALFLENVSAILQPGTGPEIGRVATDLAEMGFDASWGCYRASDVGAPHLRERCFIVAIRPDSGIDWLARRFDTADTERVEQGAQPDQRSLGRLLEPERAQRSSAAVGTSPSGTGRSDVADTEHLHDGLLARQASRGALDTPGAQRDSAAGSPRDTGGSDAADTEHQDLHHVPDQSARGRALGHRGAQRSSAAGIPSGPRDSGAADTEHEDAQLRREARRAGALESERAQRDSRKSQWQWGIYDEAIRRWEPIVGREVPVPLRPLANRRNPQVTAEMLEWMMGLPEGWVTGVRLSRAATLKLIGNGVVPQCASRAWVELSRELLCGN